MPLYPDNPLDWMGKGPSGLVIPTDPDVWGHVMALRMDGGEIDQAGIDNLAAFVALLKTNGAWDSLQGAYSAKWGKKFVGSTVSTLYSPKRFDRLAQVTTASRRPAYQATGMNGFPTLLFDGIDDLLSMEAMQRAFRDVASGTIMSVAQSNGNTGRRVVFMSAGATGNPRALQDCVTTGWRASGRRLDADATTVVIMTNTVSAPSIVASNYDWGNSDLTVWRNRGTPEQNTSFGTDGNTSDTDSGTRRIGADSANSFNGLISFVALFSPLLTLAQRQDLEAFLASNSTGWNITLT